MTVHVGSLTTEVSVEEERRPADDARQGRDWEENAKLAALLARRIVDELRTRARGHDD